MELPDAISTARKNAKLGVNEAAGLLGTYGSTLTRMEKGDAGIKVAMLLKMAELYKVSITQLVSGEVVREPSSLDLNMIGAVVKTIAEHLLQHSLSPTSTKLANGVVQVYKAEMTHLNDHPEDEFDLSRHSDLIETIFEE